MQTTHHLITWSKARTKIVLHGGSVVLDVALVAGKVDAVKASMDSGRMYSTY